MFPKSKQSVFTFDSLLPYFYVFLKYSFSFGKWVTIVTLHEYHSCNWIYTHSNFLFCKFHLQMLRKMKRKMNNISWKHGISFLYESALNMNHPINYKVDNGEFASETRTSNLYFICVLHSWQSKSNNVFLFFSFFNIFLFTNVNRFKSIK